ncbi:MAG TPA: hypothetical protein DCP08_04760 [Chloroflexi bacterium]|nr:hypothetical protein [Chloroflexota bacterium]
MRVREMQRRAKRPSIAERLENILALEEELGYTNRAVIGGIQRFARFWDREAILLVKGRRTFPLKRIKTLLYRYPLKDIQGRKHMIFEIRELLRKANKGKLAVASPAAIARKRDLMLSPSLHLKRQRSNIRMEPEPGSRSRRLVRRVPSYRLSVEDSRSLLRNRAARKRKDT